MGRGLGIVGGIIVGDAFVPGVGAVLAAGVLAAAILGVLGANLGKAAGGEIDEAVVASLRHDEIHIYEDALRQGRTVLIALVSSDDRAEAVRNLLLDAGAISLDMSAKRKRYCLRCSERISRSAKRCHSCGAYTLPWAYKVAVALLAITAFVLLLKLAATF